jgi:hypothetical protein
MDSILVSGPIIAENRRSLELQSLVYMRDGVTITLTEDPSGRRWGVRFEDVAVVSIRAWDLAGKTLEKLSGDGAIFQIRDDDEFYRMNGAWRFKMRYNHYIVSCYDDVLEVLAASISFEEIRM